MKDNSINTMTAEELEYIKSRYNPYSKQLKDPNVYKKTLKTSLLGSFGAVMTTGGPNAYGTRGEVTSGSWVNPPSFGDYKWSEQSLLSRIESSEKQVNMYKDKIAISMDILRNSQKAFYEAIDEFNERLKRDLIFNKIIMKKYPKKKLNLSK